MKTILKILVLGTTLASSISHAVTFTAKNGAEVTITYGDFRHTSNANGPQDDFYAGVAADQANAEAEQSRQKKLDQDAANNLVYKLDPASGNSYTCDRRDKICDYYTNRGVNGFTVVPNQLVWPQSLGILEGYFKFVINKHSVFLADPDLQEASLVMMRDYTLPMMEILSLVKSEKGKSLENIRIKSAFINGEVGYDTNPAKVKAAEAKYKGLVSKLNWDMNHQFLVTDSVAVVILAVKAMETRAGGSLSGMDAIGPNRNDVVKLAEHIKATRDPKWIKYVETVLAPFMASVSKAGLTRDNARSEIFPDYRFDIFKAMNRKSFSNLTTIAKASTQFVTLKVTKKK
jgi:hypothetical protein